MADEKHILVFGGNGFIGSTVVARLLDSYNIFLLNRGSWPCDTSQTIKPHVTQIYCDRKEPEECLERIRPQLRLRLKGQKFHAVLDFSAYRVTDIAPFYPWLKEIVEGPYVFISSDSVYEVCAKTPSPIVESYAVRPTDLEQQRRLNQAGDSYGHRKLEIEDFLAKQALVGGIPYIALRLPDVLGPRDSTNRLWQYILWIDHAMDSVPLTIPSHLQTLQTSYIYVEDIATVIQSILQLDSTSRFRVYNEAINLGLDEPKTLKEFLVLLAGALGQKPVFTDDGGVDFFPSVTRGFLDLSKARDLLGFKPTSWKVVLDSIASFYRKAFYARSNERDDALADLLEDLERIAPESVNAVKRNVESAVRGKEL